MKAKFTLVLILLTILMSGRMFAQTVSGIASNDGCQDSGIVTASSTGLGTAPQYQLLRAGVAVAPVPGDNTQFTYTAVFEGLTPGTYTVNGRATAGSTVFSSSDIVVTDDFVTLTVSTPTKVANCVGGTADLTSTSTGGKAPFTYSIATQSASNVVLQTSGPISARNFTFTGLVANNYIVSVTDACGQTITECPR